MTADALFGDADDISSDSGDDTAKVTRDDDDDEDNVRRGGDDDEGEKVGTIDIHIYQKMHP